MEKTGSITIWPGCDVSLANAIEKFSQSWGPYSSRSRSYSIFRLIRELIDPVWFSICQVNPALSHEELNRAWSRYQDERIRRDLKHCAEIDQTGVYPLSVVADRLGFNELDWFIKAVAGNSAEKYGDLELVASLDSLRELAIACKAKKPKRKSHGKVNSLRGNDTCRLCSQSTELSAHVAGNAWPEEDIDDQRLRLSSLYCSDHRPKEVFSNVVRADYLRAKRNQDAFDKELERLDRQSWAGTSAALAKSGNPLVDEFIRQLSVHRCLTYEQQPLNKLDTLETRLRWEARMIVDRRISDRKKEIIILLLSGMNQTEAAKHLGIARQAISKALQTIPQDYRLDILGIAAES